MFEAAIFEASTVPQQQQKVIQMWEEEILLRPQNQTKHLKEANWTQLALQAEIEYHGSG